MAVFTEVSFERAAQFVERFDVGALTDLQGCASGIENTNYFATTTGGEYVLTLFERLTAEQLPFYLHLMKHLAGAGIPVPEPKADAQGEILHDLLGKPAALVDKLKGRNQLAPLTPHCEQVGAMLARMHVAGQDFSMHQPNLRGLTWWQETIPVVLAHLSPDLQGVIERELAVQVLLAQSPQAQSLPRGPIHADLFRDNVMFDGDALTGFFDFYFAGVDTWLFDMAVCLNDWCCELDSGALDRVRAQAFVAAYESIRPLSDEELNLLPYALRAAALRFWTSRLWDFYLPRDAQMLKPHDPTHFERILLQRIQFPWHYVRS